MGWCALYIRMQQERFVLIVRVYVLLVVVS